MAQTEHPLTYRETSWVILGYQYRLQKRERLLLSWPVCDNEVKAGEEESPAGMPWVQSFGFSEIFKVAMVCDDFKLMLGSLQSMSHSFKLVVEASTSTTKGSSGLGCARVGAIKKDSLRWCNAFVAEGFQHSIQCTASSCHHFCS